MKSTYIFLLLFLLLVEIESAKQNDSKHGHYNVHGGKHGHKRYQVLTFNYERIKLPFGVSLWLLFATVVKVAFHNSSKVTSFIPFCAMEIILGLVIGGVLYLASTIFRYADLIKLSPFLFFIYLLPPIVFEAGYSMPLRPFFGNVGTILVYAVIGTIWNVLTIGLSLYVLSKYGVFPEPTSILSLLLFSSIIAAVDPVAVLTVFEEIQVNELLYICVFGESLLNDAVTVVLYHMFESFLHIGQENIIPIDMLAGGASFFVVALGGLLIGLVWAVITAFVTKYTNHTRVVQPLICLLFPYLSYLTAELFHVSGIVAIVFCGMAMKQYVKDNITRSSNTTVKYFLKTLSSISETVIFIFLGISTITQWAQHVFDIPFILLTLLFCLGYRFIGVFAITFIMNRFRLVKVSAVDQMIMAYGGLRGAVAYGLAASLVESKAVNDKTARMFLTTTIIITLFTVFIQGTTVKPVVSLLKVKRIEKRDITMTERIFVNMTDHAMSGIEVISGHRGTNYLKHLLSRLHKAVFYRFLVHKHRKVCPENLLGKFRQMNEQDAKDYMRRHGGLTVLNPNLQSNFSSSITENTTSFDSLAELKSMSPSQRAKLRWRWAYKKVRAEIIADTVSSEFLLTLYKRSLIHQQVAPVSVSVQPSSRTRRYSRHTLYDDEDEVDNDPTPAAKLSSASHRFRPKHQYSIGKMGVKRRKSSSKRAKSTDLPSTNGPPFPQVAFKSSSDPSAPKVQAELVVMRF